MKAIPVPLRERILKLYDQGKNTVEIAAFSGCKPPRTLSPRSPSPIVRASFYTPNTIYDLWKCSRRTLTDCLWMS